MWWDTYLSTYLPTYLPTFLSTYLPIHRGHHHQRSGSVGGVDILAAAAAINAEVTADPSTARRGSNPEPMATARRSSVTSSASTGGEEEAGGGGVHQVPLERRRSSIKVGR